MNGNEMKSFSKCVDKVFTFKHLAGALLQSDLRAQQNSLKAHGAYDFGQVRSFLLTRTEPVI